MNKRMRELRKAIDDIEKHIRETPRITGEMIVCLRDSQREAMIEFLYEKAKEDLNG